MKGRKLRTFQTTGNTLIKFQTHEPSVEKSLPLIPNSKLWDFRKKKKVIQFRSHRGTAGDCEMWWERNCETNCIKISWNIFLCVCVIVPNWESKTFWKENVFRKTQWYQFIKFSKWKRASSNYENPMDLTLSSHLINDFLNCDWEIIARIRVSLTRDCASVLLIWP